MRLSEAEWETAIEFLTKAAHITTYTRQAFVLPSDALGLSMQTITINNESVGDATEATVFGRFFVDDAPRSRTAKTWRSARTGSPAGSRVV